MASFTGSATVDIDGILVEASLTAEVKSRILRLTSAPTFSFDDPGNIYGFRAWFLEPNESVSLQVTLSEDVEFENVAISLVAEGDARPGVDFSADLTPKVLKPGEKTLVTIEALEPPRYRRYRTLVLRAESTDAVPVVYDEFRVVLWQQNITPLEASWGTFSIAALDPGESVTLRATIEAPADETVEIPLDYALTATPGSDFTVEVDGDLLPTNNPVISFAPGQTTKFVKVTNTRSTSGSVQAGISFALATETTRHNQLIRTDGGDSEPTNKNDKIGPDSIPAFPTDFWFGVDNVGTSTDESLVYVPTGLVSGVPVTPTGELPSHFYHTKKTAGTRGGILKSFQPGVYNGWDNVVEGALAPAGTVNCFSAYLAYADSPEIPPGQRSDYFKITLLNRSQQGVSAPPGEGNWNQPFGPHTAVFQFDDAVGTVTGVPRKPFFLRFETPPAPGSVGYYAAQAGFVAGVVTGDLLDDSPNQGYYRCFVAFDLQEELDVAFPGPDEDRPSPGDTMQYIVRLSSVDDDGLGGDPGNQPEVGAILFGFQFEHFARPGTFDAAGVSGAIAPYQSVDLEWTSSHLGKRRDAWRQPTSPQPVLTLNGV